MLKCRPEALENFSEWLKNQAETRIYSVFEKILQQSD
jgi:hypothetical protein